MAKCVSCGAPLPGGELNCAYCGTRNNVDLQAIGGWTTADPHAERRCPCCDVQLSAIKLEAGKPLHVERCEKCEGLFFDPDELPYLVESRVKNVFQVQHRKLAKLSSRALPSRRKRLYIPCPICQNLMTSVSYGPRSGVVVDWCKPHGVWLDGGELRRIMEWAKLGGLAQKGRQRFHISQPGPDDEADGLETYTYDPKRFDFEGNRNSRTTVGEQAFSEIAESLFSLFR